MICPLCRGYGEHFEWCSLGARFFDKVNFEGPTFKGEPCWLWEGRVCPRGYGYFGHNSQRCHRVLWVALNGPVPEGLELDHLCRVRNCVNPAHLEPVTHAENMRRAG